LSNICEISRAYPSLFPDQSISLKTSTRYSIFTADTSLNLAEAVTARLTSNMRLYCAWCSTPSPFPIEESYYAHPPICLAYRCPFCNSSEPFPVGEKTDTHVRTCPSNLDREKMQRKHDEMEMAWVPKIQIIPPEMVQRQGNEQTPTEMVQKYPCPHGGTPEMDVGEAMDKHIVRCLSIPITIKSLIKMWKCRIWNQCTTDYQQPQNNMEV
jgi:hypothetical protein